MPVPMLATACPDAPTLNDLLDAYTDEYLPTKAPIMQYQQHHYYKVLRRDLGARALTALTPAVLRHWRDTLAARYAPGTVRCYLHALAAPLTVAVRDYAWLPEHPMKRVKKPPVPPGRTRFLSDEELARLLTACQQSTNRHIYPLVLLALSTGGRRNELLGLRWQDVDLVRGTVQFLRTKNGAARTVPVTGEALHRLAAHRTTSARPEAWVFPRPDGRKPMTLAWSWTLVRERAHLEDFRFHDLRHTCASYLAMSGASLLEIAAVLGHKTLAMVQRYAHMTDSHMVGVLERMTSTLPRPNNPV